MRQGLSERQIGQRPHAQVDAPPGEHLEAGGRSMVAGLDDGAGLAHPGIATDDHAGGGTGESQSHQLAQALELADSGDERRGRTDESHVIHRVTIPPDCACDFS